MKWLIGSVAVLAMLVSATAAHATPISGELNITGSAKVTKTTIDWVPLGGPNGTAFIVDPGTGYFATISSPVSGINTAKSLDLPAGPFPVANFLNHFVTPDPRYTDLSFTLGGFVSTAGTPVCTGSETVGQTCVAFVGSPFLLTKTARGTAIEFDVFGSFVDLTYGDNGTLNQAIGIYTSNVSGKTPKQLSTTINGGGAISASYSAQFTAVPEPLTLSLLGMGVGAAALRRRRQAVTA